MTPGLDAGRSIAAQSELGPSLHRFLRSFTMEDLAALGIPSVAPAAESWAGWSTDGVDWEWQDAVDVFGTSFSPDLAVGSGFLLAHVSGASQKPSRWFMAKIPSG